MNQKVLVCNLVRIFKLRPSLSVEHTPFLLPSLLVGMVLLQGWFGMWTVTLYLWPQVVTQDKNEFHASVFNLFSANQVLIMLSEVYRLQIEGIL